MAGQGVRAEHDSLLAFNNVRAVIRAAVADRAIPFDVTLNVTTPPCHASQKVQTMTG